MSNPRPESRIKSLEQRATDIEADIVELASDQAEELKIIRQEIKSLRHFTEQGFAQAHAYIQEHIESVMATKDDIAELKELIKQLIPYKPNA